MRNRSDFTYAAMLVCGLLLILCFSVQVAAANAPERYEVVASWLDSDTLHIAVTDTADGTVSEAGLRLSDYSDSAAVITLEIIDAEGKASGVVRIDNPFYEEADEEVDVAASASASSTTELIAISNQNNDVRLTPSHTPASSVSAIPNGAQPFTPDGSGTVLDIVPEAQGKEFFTIDADGSIFFLVVDRQRREDNVYLLSAVTKADLVPLAEKEEQTVSAIPEPPTQPPSTEPEPPPPITPTPSPGLNSNSLLLILLIALVAGGAAYYLKIFKPRQSRAAEESRELYEDGYDEWDEEDEDYTREEV